MGEKQQMTAGEAARRLGISWGLLWKLEAIKVTPPARRIGRFRVYSDGEVEMLREIIEQRRASQQPRGRLAEAA